MPDHDSSDKQVHGEGNYEASRKYNEATKKFVESGKVDAAARKAAPNSGKEAAELASAESAGRARAKEEDPALLKSPAQPPAGGSRPNDR